MALRIPTDASNQVQQAFRDLDANGLTEAEVRSFARDEIAKASRLQQANQSPVVPIVVGTGFPNINDVMRQSGPGHSLGYVPDPGPATGSDCVLHEDAQWKWPLSGNLQDVSDFDGEGPIKKYLLSGGLIINGPLTASDCFFGTVTKLGGLPRITISSVANVTTGETDLLSLQLQPGVLAIGTGLKITATLTFAGNGNSKTIKAVFGATSMSLGTLAYNGVRGVITVYILYNTATTQRMYASLDVFGNSTAERSTPGETAANSILFKFTGTGGASADITMDEMVVEGIGVP